MCDAAGLLGFDDPDGESAHPCDIFRAVACSDSTPVFIVVPIDDVMTAILDRPMATVNVEDMLWLGLLRRSTGDAVSHFTRALATLFVDELPFDGKRLSNVGKVKVVVELGGGPDFTRFNASMLRWIKNDVVWFLAVLEKNAMSLRTVG